MGRISLVLHGIRYQVVASRFESSVAVSLHFLRGVIKHSGVIGGPLYLRGRLFAKAGYLRWIELELAEHDLLTLKEVASVGPSEKAWIVETAIFKQRAVDLSV